MIGDAVVRTLELRDLPFAGERNGGTNRVHDRLGSGVAEPDAFDGWHALLHLLGQLDFHLGRPVVRSASRRLHTDGVDNGRMGVAQNQGRVVEGKIKEMVTVDVIQVYAGGAIDIGRERIEPGAGASISSGKHPCARSKSWREVGLRVTYSETSASMLVAVLVSVIVRYSCFSLPLPGDARDA